MFQSAFFSLDGAITEHFFFSGRIYEAFSQAVGADIGTQSNASSHVTR